MFKYIDENYLKTYGFTPDPEDTELIKNIYFYINVSCEKINSISGNRIEEAKFENLNSVQQELVKRATSYYCVWLIKNGMQWFRGGMSIATQGISISQNGPEEPDYVLENVYRLLQQAQLYFPRAYGSINDCEEPNNENPLSEQNFYTGLYSGCDYPISWRAARANFIQADTKHFLSSDDSVSFKFGKINGEIETTIDIKAKGSGTGGIIESAKLPLVIDNKVLKLNFQQDQFRVDSDNNLAISHQGWFVNPQNPDDLQYYYYYRFPWVHSDSNTPPNRVEEDMYIINFKGKLHIFENQPDNGAYDPNKVIATIGDIPESFNKFNPNPTYFKYDKTTGDFDLSDSFKATISEIGNAKKIDNIPINFLKNTTKK